MIIHGGIRDFETKIGQSVILFCICEEQDGIGINFFFKNQENRSEAVLNLF